MTDRGRVLLVGDAPDAAALDAALSDRGFRLSVAALDVDETEALQSHGPDAVVALGQRRPGEALDLIRRLCTLRPGLPVVLVLAPAAAQSARLADRATRAGAFAIVSQSSDPQALVLAIDRAIEHRALRREVRRLARVVSREPQTALLGNSRQMRRVEAMLEPAATSDVSVLITGESGTGKEVAARALHRRSRQSAGPFVAVNLAAVPHGLLESELFGHARGAFTDARTARKGLFVQADSGTLFLDEVGELARSVQAKLLRALQERVVRPVGSDREVPFSARVVAATNQDLEARVRAGQFREDLFYRLAVIHLELPPLRERGADILLLANHILERITSRTGKPVRGIAPEAARLLLAWRWPGNVRELENVLERAVALTSGQEITADDLPQRMQGIAPSVLPPSDTPVEDLVSMEVIESRYIQRVLEAVGHNKAHAARVLGFDRKTLYRKLQRGLRQS